MVIGEWPLLNKSGHSNFRKVATGRAHIISFLVSYAVEHSTRETRISFLQVADVPESLSISLRGLRNTRPPLNDN